MKLPFLVSLPHAGLDVPEELKDYSILSQDEIRYDGDEGAGEIYAGLKDKVVAFQTTNIARAYIDLNREANDIRLDGVVKTHTILNKPIYNRQLPNALIQTLISKYWKPYHENLSSKSKGIKLGIDCHTMLAVGPPVGPDSGNKRPAVCLSNAEGTCPDKWIQSMAECFEKAFQNEVRINDPFKGGNIIRSHAAEIPWIQIEISRGDFMTIHQKRESVISALHNFFKLQNI